MATRSLGSLTVDLIAKVLGWEQGMDKAGRAADKMSRKTQRSMRDMESQINAVTRRVRGYLVGAFAGISLVGFTRSLVDANVEMQKIQYTMQQAFGTGSQREIAFIRKMSDDLGLSFKDAAQGFAQLAASAQGTGASAQDLETFFKGVSQAAAVLHSSTKDVSGVLVQLSQGLSLGKLNMQDFRAIAQHLPGTMTLVNKALAKMGTNLKDALKGGGVDAVQLIKNLGEAMQERFGKQAVEASHSLNAELNRLRSTLFHMQTDGTGFADTFAKALRNVNDQLTDPAIKDSLHDLITGFGNIASAAVTAAAKIGDLFKQLKGYGEFVAKMQNGAGGFDFSGLSDELSNIQDELKQRQKHPALSAINSFLAGTENNIVQNAIEGGRPRIQAMTTEQLRARAAQIQQQIRILQSLQKNVSVKNPQEDDERGLLFPLGPTTSSTSKPISPTIKRNIDDVAKAYQALADASHEYANSLNQDDAQYKAEKTERESLQNLTQLRDAYVKLTGDAATANKLFDAGLKGIKDRFNYDLSEPQRQLEKYTKSLNDQLDALKQSNEVRLAGMTLSDREAQNMAELAQDTQDATKQISDFIAAHQLMNGKLSKSDQDQLDALKAHLADRHDIIMKSQQDEDAMRGDWMAGAKKAMANFINQTNNLYQQSQTFIDNFANGFADAFTEFATGAKSAKDAFGDFIDDLYAQALRFVANQAIAKFFKMLKDIGNNNDVEIGTSSVSSGGGGFWNWVGSFFGGKRAGGGPVLAGSMYRVNEQGPEMLSIGREDYLMMGSRSGHVTPASRSSAGGGTTINVAVQPTSSRRTADQVATAIARQQRLATARNG